MVFQKSQLLFWEERENMDVVKVNIKKEISFLLSSAE